MTGRDRPPGDAPATSGSSVVVPFPLRDGATAAEPFARNGPQGNAAAAGTFADGSDERGGHTVGTVFRSHEGEPHIVRKVGRLMELHEVERAQLRALARAPFRVAPRTVLLRRGEPAAQMLLLVSGMAAEVCTDREGRRHSSRFFLPGDMIGARDMALDRYAADAVAMTDCLLVAVPRTAFLHAADTRLWRLFHLVRQVEQAIAADRIGVLARGRAAERVLSILLELHARQRLGAPWIKTTVWLPLTQGDIGQAAGLTNVYVSKVLTQMRGNGTIRSQTGNGSGRVITLGDTDRLADRIDFVDRYASLDAARAAAGPVGDLLGE